jgi:hypothetical protein
VILPLNLTTVIPGAASRTSVSSMRDIRAAKLLGQCRDSLELYLRLCLGMSGFLLKIEF